MPCVRFGAVSRLVLLAALGAGLSCADDATTTGDEPPGGCSEPCDDGNVCTGDTRPNDPGDCSVACVFTPITACIAGDGCCAPGCDHSTDDDCSLSCGNGTLEDAESCDDGNTVDDGNGCSAGCQRNDVCGDGIVQSLFEACDDGGVLTSTYCSSDCQGSVLTGATYYFSTSMGDDSRTSAEAQDPATPWQSLEKLSSLFPELQPGDSVLFRRGDSFDGGIIIAASGSAEQPIALGAYGSGPKPILNGLTTLTNWTELDGGVYQSACAACPAELNLVVLDGEAQALGRYPDTGYLTIDSVGTSSITDDDLPETPIWTGEIVTRTVHWVLDRNRITEHTGHTITYEPATSYYSASPGFGYFIQNDPATLTRLGEWYFEPSGQQLQMYFGPEGPASHTVEASAVDTLISISGQQYLLFDNLALRGANATAVLIEASPGIKLQNCDVDLSGRNAIKGPWQVSSDHLSIESTHISHTNNNAITLSGDFPDALIRNNTIESTGMLPGMGGSGDEQYNAVETFGSNTTIELNTVKETGYIAINFEGSHVVVKNNLVDGFTLVKDDGGGIYTYAETTEAVDRQVIANVVLNGVGAPEGTADAFSGSEGIYLDGYTQNVVVQDNSVAYCAYSGIFVNDDQGGEISNNTTFDNEVGLGIVSHAYDPIRSLSVHDNVFFAKEAAQGVLAINSNADDFAEMGTFDHNYYARPLDNATPVLLQIDWVGSPISLDDWQSLYGQDLGSTVSPIALDSSADIAFFLNDTRSDRTFTLDQPMIDVTATKFSGTLTLPPFSSAVLMVDPSP